MPATVALTPLAQSLRRLSSAALLVTMLCIGASAQSKATDGSTPLALASGAPAGSYSLSGFDTVNLYNGSLNFRLPLVGIGGRGGAGHTILLPVERHWEVEHLDDPTAGSMNYPVDGAWEEINPGYGPGVMHVRYGGAGQAKCNFNPQPEEPVFRYVTALTRLSFTAPDGTETEFRDVSTSGSPHNVGTSCTAAGFSRGTVFASVDGSGATFVSDSDIRDRVLAGGEVSSYNVSGYMLLRDGTRYRIGGGLVEWVRDRNGNKVTFAYAANRLTAVTDSLNRQVTVAYDSQEGGQYGTCDRITYKGFGGAQRVVRVCKSSLGGALRTGFSLQTEASLFPGLQGSNYTAFNPTVVSAVYLPDGDGVTRRYRLLYDSHGELARVELPTGGAYEYDFGAGLSGGGSGGVIFSTGMKPQIYRRVLERRVYSNGTALESRMIYSLPESESPTCCSTANAGYVVAEARDAAGSLLGKTKHYFNGAGAAPTLLQGSLTLADWIDGREYQTDTFGADGTTVLRQTSNTWQAGGGAYVNPRVAETVSTLNDANLIAKQTFAYDQYNNQTDVYDYDYGAGSPGALLRRTHTDYLATNPVNGSDYTAAGVHLRSLPAQVSVYDAAGAEQARTTFEYDNYAQDATHAPLTSRANISGHDAAMGAGYQTRGNATGTSRWLLPNASALASYAQYDEAGNAVKVIDARGYQTTLDFADRYGAPDGEARSNVQPAELGAQLSYAFPTSATNALGHVSFSQFDYYLGKPVEAEDINGVISTGYYDDVLDRPTRLVLASGTGVQSQTSFAYDDAARVVTTTGDLNAYGDNLLKSESLYDQLGRAYETRQYESATAYSATRRSYDALGRAYRMSSPFRPAQGQTPLWTSTQFDALGRAVNVLSPDGSHVSTAYLGSQVTVTDQAGKSRRSVTDALGRMTQVVEDPAGLAYVTNYTYDVLGNLRKIDQGGQLRYFMYDSVSRLLRSKSPEQAANPTLALADTFRAPEDGTPNSQWSVAYAYDANGNLTQKTDARGVVINYAYDALDRNTATDYSTTAISPDVERFYDNPAAGAYGKGRFWHNYAGGDTNQGLEVEHTAVDGYDAMGRPLAQRQLFKTAGAWGATYRTARAYNLAGGVTSQTYPSGRSVSYTYDPAGRLQSFAGNLGDATQRTYSSNVSYDEASRMREERFGTDMPLYHKLHYNVRGQLFDVRLSTVAWGQANGEWNWNRGALLNYYSQAEINAPTNEGHGLSGVENNGNLKRASVYVPTDPNAAYSDAGAGSYYVAHDDYSYDPLNRLASVAEMNNAGAGTLSQAYSYDRFGNRQIDAAGTSAGLNNKQFAVDTSTNRLTHAGMAYDAAGNLTQDTYSAQAAQRAYDAENRMTTEQSSTTSVFSRYVYDADGRRTRRDVGGAVTWQVYGFSGEPLAEYAGGAAPDQPQREYGYRAGELLVTAEGGSRVNVASAAQGATASASSYTPDNTYGAGLHTRPSDAIDGVRAMSEVANGTGYWRANPLPQWLEVAFTGARTISEIDVYTVRDNYTSQSDPTASETFTLYGTTSFNLQYWDGAAWQNIPGASVSGNNLVWRKLTFASITTAKIRLNVTGAADGVTRVTELEAYTAGAGAQVNWLVSDHLGTPRMVVDQSGSLSGVRRHDYLPFGEELQAGQAGRAQAMGYAGDAVKQKYTGYEKDSETGLNFAEARYHSESQGRFTSPDPYGGSMKLSDPQSLNRYSYVGNSPTAFSDPSGMERGHAAAHTAVETGDFSGLAREHSEDYTAEDAAAYEQRLADTYAAIAEAHAINDGLRDGSLTNEQAAAMAASNPMIRAVGVDGPPENYSANSVMVVVWNNMWHDSWNPDRWFGHVSYITMQDDTSLSWEGVASWTDMTPSSKYTDKRSKDSAGIGIMLDFGPDLNAKFQSALLAAPKTRVGVNAPYHPTDNNCTRAFVEAFNAISGDLKMRKLDYRSFYLPAQVKEFVMGSLRPYVAGVTPFPKH